MIMYKPTDDIFYDMIDKALEGRCTSKSHDERWCAHCSSMGDGAENMLHYLDKQGWKLVKADLVDLKVISAGVNEETGFPDTHCDRCGMPFKDENDTHQTCTETDYVTLCTTCYRKAGNNVR